MRKLLIALMVLPAVALAQGAKTDKPQAESGSDPTRAEKRMRLARTLGMAEVLDLDAAQALKVGDTMARYDDKRKAIGKQAADARDVLRAAAQSGGKATANQVDGAIAKLLDARRQLQALDKDMLQAVTKDLSPEQRARAALFLGSFRHRVERHMMFHPGPGGPGGPGRWNQRDDDRHGMMMGPGGGQMARGPQGIDDDDPPFADDTEED